MNKRLRGILPPITTPFDSDGRLLVDAYRSNLERWVRYPLGGLLVLGSNAETPYLSDEEKLLLVREARPRIDKTLIVGARQESTLLCIEFIRKVADLGADYALVGTPCYFKSQMTDDALFAHFWSIADESPIPILIYNVPQFTGINTSAPLIEKLSTHENIAGMKESSANLPLQAEIRFRTPERFEILTGSASTLLPSLIQGAAGGIVAVACALPAQTIGVYDAFCSGDWKVAAELQQRLNSVSIPSTRQYGIPGLKVAMDLMGFAGGEPRMPLLPLNEKQKSVLKSIFQAAGLLDAAQGT